MTRTAPEFAPSSPNFRTTHQKDPDVMNNFVISLAVRRRPQMILYNIDGEIEAEELQIGLLEKNLFLRDENNYPLFRVDFPIQARNGKGRHWVVSLEPSIFREFNNLRGLYFQWNRIRFSEFVGVRQCRAYLKFGHTAKNCVPGNQPRCARCGEFGRENHVCRATRCNNCVYANEKFKLNIDTRHVRSIENVVLT
ncbi:hypothetical protein AVEN_131288-1 [Araneus ventricosus]|uniref:CCHC-type domain-containing protein n=1 Tax=Araneus ventricosus TaxID=182803 RepID=A0A4Y2HF75_ARAVE|nr:hypothetical protein AVEN_131288-1 [Araneus ventricosus]